jgi:site-specific DNA-adenine methylase
MPLQVPRKPALPLKMPGSKARTMPQILGHLPEPAPGRGFVVPCFGTGADSAWISAAGGRLVMLGDASPRIAGLMRALRSRPTAVLAGVEWLAAQYHACEDAEAKSRWYLALRERVNAMDLGADLNPAALLVFWRLSFNGFLRVNAANVINSGPAWSERHPPPARVVDLEALRAFAGWLAASPPVACADLRETCRCAQPGDVVYLDPPYEGTFDGFTAGGFDSAAVLGPALADLRHRGVSFALSNAPAVLGLTWTDPGGVERFVVPPAARVRWIERAGTVSAGKDRKARPEVLLVWEPDYEAGWPREPTAVAHARPLPGLQSDEATIWA